jgi:hypothetical protein
MTRGLISALLASVVALPLLLGPVLPAQAGWFKSDREALSCDDPHILKRISSKFRHQAREVHHEPELSINAYDRVHEHRYQEERVGRPTARRYCMATATLSDGRERSVWYLIERGVGFASVGDNVEFCVSGFDKWNVYNNSCRILR